MHRAPSTEFNFDVVGDVRFFNFSNTRRMHARSEKFLLPISNFN